MGGKVTEEVLSAVREKVQDGRLRCAQAFRVAADLHVSPGVVGQAANALNVHLSHCQLGLFGYGEAQRVVEPATEVSPELAQAIQEGLVLGRLPCAVAWSIARRFSIPKMRVANAAEKLGVRLAQCQLGAF